jgi:hypothetical protein
MTSSIVEYILILVINRAECSALRDDVSIIVNLKGLEIWIEAFIIIMFNLLVKLIQKIIYP